MTTEVEEKARRLKDVLVDVQVEADLSRGVNEFWIRMGKTHEEQLERRAKDLEEAVRSFESFLRDHRSMDWVRLYVNRIRQDQCSVCHRVWETHQEEGVTYCSNCGTEVETSS